MMKVRVIVGAALLIFAIGCSATQPNGGPREQPTRQVIEDLEGNRPPKAEIRIGDRRYDTRLGTFCWKSTCADSVGPAELLKDAEPISVRPGATIEFVMDYMPQPNRFHIERFSEGNRIEVEPQGNRFEAPAEEGTYYYSYGVWWMDEETDHLSHGDAFYYFVVRVVHPDKDEAIQAGEVENIKLTCAQMCRQMENPPFNNKLISSPGDIAAFIEPIRHAEKMQGILDYGVIFHMELLHKDGTTKQYALNIDNRDGSTGLLVDFAQSEQGYSISERDAQILRAIIYGPKPKET